MTLLQRIHGVPAIALWSKDSSKQRLLAGVVLSWVSSRSHSNISSFPQDLAGLHQLGSGEYKCLGCVAPLCKA
jgi:hypothetical protein